MSEEATNVKVGASSAGESGDSTVSAAKADEQTKTVEDNPSDAQVGCGDANLCLQVTRT